MKEKLKCVEFEGNKAFWQFTDRRPRRPSSALLLAILLLSFETSGFAQHTIEQKVRVSIRHSFDESGENDPIFSTVETTKLGSNLLDVDSDLGEACAESSLRSGPATGVPIFRSWISGNTVGDPHSVGNSPLTGNGGSAQATVTQTIGDRIRFEKTDPFGPGHAKSIGFTMVLSGFVSATSPVDRIKEDRTDLEGNKWTKTHKRPKARASNYFTLSISGGGSSIKKIAHHLVNAGDAASPPISAKFDEYREEIKIEPFAFNFEEQLIIEFISHSVGWANSWHPSQAANFVGDLRSTIYFTGFKFYDDLGNQIPDGAYSARGLRNTDWTLSNVPVRIKVIESGRDQDNFTIRFTGPAGEVGWLVKASTDLVAFSLDLTPVSAITETIPGTYEAVIDVSGQGDNLFVRVEQNVAAEVPEADLLLKPE